MGARKKKKSADPQQLLGNSPDLVNMTSFLHRWCQKERVIPTFEVSSTPMGTYISDLTVEGYSCKGHGEASKKKDANAKASKEFVMQLVDQGILKKEDCPLMEEESEEELRKNGFWDEKNSKYKLNMYFVENGINVKYDCHSAGTDENCHSGFVCEMSADIHQIGKTVTGTGKGSSKSVASRKCAVSIIRQLFHLNLIEAFSSQKKPKGPTRTTANFQSEVSPELAVDVDETLEFYDIDPEAKPNENGAAAAAENAKTTTLSVSEPASVIQVLPPQANYHTWTGEPIKDGPLRNISLHNYSSVLQKKYREKLNTPPFSKMQQELRRYPIFNYRQKILDTVHVNPFVIIKGNTNCGKTTQVCQYILDNYIQSGFGGYCNVVVAEPSPISISELANVVASQRIEELGESIGYSRKLSSTLPRPFGSIMFCSIDDLLRRMEFGLRGVSHIILDEFHLRDMKTDFLLAVLKDMVKICSNIRILILTAPIDTQPLKKYLNKAGVIDVTVKSHPIKEYFLEDFVEESGFQYQDNPKALKIQIKAEEAMEESETKETASKDQTPSKKSQITALPDRYSERTKKVIETIGDGKASFYVLFAVLEFINNMNIDGDILAIFSGFQAVVAFKRYISHLPEATTNAFSFVPLFSTYSQQEQNKQDEKKEEKENTDDKPKRKVLLATGAIETSYSLRNITFVVDSGLEKKASFASNNRSWGSTLWVPKFNIALRKGRAGRERSGYYFYMSTKARFESLEECYKPEIQRCYINDLALYIKLLSLGSVKEFLGKTLDPPTEELITKAEARIKDLSYLGDDGKLTRVGHVLARLPTESRKGRMLLLASALSCGDAACALVALQVVPRDLIIRSSHSKRINKHSVGSDFSDHISLLKTFIEWEEANMNGEEAEKEFCQDNHVQSSVAKNVLSFKNELKNILISSGIPAEYFTRDVYEAEKIDYNMNIMVGLLTLSCFPNVSFYTRWRKLMLKDTRLLPMDSSSINSRMPNSHFRFPSSIFIFDRKVNKPKHRLATCKCVTMVSAIHLLLFGSSQIEYQQTSVKLDGWLKVNMAPDLARKIYALRGVVQSIITSFVENKGMDTSEKYQKAVKCLRDLLEIDPGCGYTVYVEDNFKRSHPMNFPMAKRFKQEGVVAPTAPPSAEDANAETYQDDDHAKDILWF